MIRDFDDFADGLIIETDVCVIGSGPAGMALANEFIGTSTDVSIVESGGMGVEPAIQSLNASQSVGAQHSEHQKGRARAFGGTAKSWAGQCLRLDPIDFEQREWVPFSGWPIQHESLHPYYERAEMFFGVQGHAYDAHTYSRLGIGAPDWSAKSVQSRFTVYSPNIDIGRHYRQQLQRSRNITTYLHANAIEIKPQCEGAAFTVVLKTLNGQKTSFIKARIVVVAAGALENARLLLNSGRRTGNGLGNERDLVGRFFQDHPNGLTATLRGGMTKVLSPLFRLAYQDGIRFFPKFCLSSEVQRTNRVLNGIAHLTFEYGDSSGIQAMRKIVLAVRKRRYPPHIWTNLRHAMKDIGPVSNTLVKRLSGRSTDAEPSAIRLQCHLEQSPDPQSRVQLTEEKDALGMRGIAVDWRRSELELQTAQILTQTVAAQFKRLNLGIIEPHDWLQEGRDWQDHTFDCAHHIGTTRMSNTKQTGVVDSSCQVFDVPGLYIAGSSVFPTSGYANPTLTIAALSIRLADCLKQRLN